MYYQDLLSENDRLRRQTDNLRNQVQSLLQIVNQEKQMRSRIVAHVNRTNENSKVCFYANVISQALIVAIYLQCHNWLHLTNFVRINVLITVYMCDMFSTISCN